MTKAEFIDFYFRQGGPPDAVKNEDGCLWTDKDGSTHQWLALNCNCGEGGCQGWAMVPAELADMHRELNPT